MAEDDRDHPSVEDQRTWPDQKHMAHASDNGVPWSPPLGARMFFDIPAPLPPKECSVEGPLNPIHIVPGLSDADRAKAHKTAISQALRIAMDAIDAATTDGFQTTFALAKGHDDKQFIVSLTLAKHF